MKTIVIAALFASGAVCATLAAVSPLTNAPPKKYSFTLTRVEKGTTDIPTGIFSFRHSLDAPVSLYGFSLEGDVFRPRFPEFERKEDGEWKDVEAGYCGTGARFFSLKPDTDYTLRIELWPFVKSKGQGRVKIFGDKQRFTSEGFFSEKVQEAIKTADEKPSKALPKSSETNSGDGEQSWDHKLPKGGQM